MKNVKQKMENKKCYQTYYKLNTFRTNKEACELFCLYKR